MTAAPALQAVPRWATETLVRCGLVPGSETSALRGVPVTGGVSSAVWRVDLATGPVCVKRALPELAVEGSWQAPTVRSTWEARWLGLAAELVPGAACPLLATDDDHHTIVLAWLDPALHPVWKEQLAAGHVDRAVAAEVGRRLAALHAAFVPHRDGFAAARPLFEDLRLRPYLRVTADKHPGVATQLLDLAAALATSDITVIHGDVSPKNILVGPNGPVLLDAECASPGDPAFDLAFCVNHLLLKAAWHSHDRGALLDAAAELIIGYRDAISWEEPAGLERRMAALVPALALARVDGLSPVEYLSEEDRSTVRRAAIAGLTDPPLDRHELIAQWRDALNAEDA